MNEKADVDARQNVKEVIYSYLKWFLGAAFLAGLGSMAAYYANAFVPLSGFQIRIFQIFSLVLEVTSLGQCGYSIQTWGGTSLAEKLNQKLFAIVSSIGFFFIVFSFQLEALESI
ncbi:MAG: hypothetical protein WA347_06810 [Rhabdochlamydiaceae bacterium]|jgi:hypothetical protein